MATTNNTPIIILREGEMLHTDQGKQVGYEEDPFLTQRRRQVLAERRRASVPYLAKINAETLATIAREEREHLARTYKHLKVIK